MKIYKKLGLILLAGILVMTLMPTTNAAAPATPVKLDVIWVDETTVTLNFAVVASNYTVIEYMAPPPNTALTFGLGDGTSVINTSSLTTYKLEGLTADTTYYFQCWNQFYTTRNHTGIPDYGANLSANIHMPPVLSGGGGVPWVPPADDTDYTTPPASLLDDPFAEIPGFELITLMVAIGIAFILIKRRPI